MIFEKKKQFFLLNKYKMPNKQQKQAWAAEDKAKKLQSSKK